MDLWSVYRQYEGVFYKPELARLFGGLTCGLVLSQVLYWFTPDERGRPRVRTVVDGELWLALTYDEWETATALSEYQVRSAMQGLEAQGVLRRRKAQIRGRGWLTCVQLDQGRLLQALSTDPEETAVPEETTGPPLRNLMVVPKKLEGDPEETSGPIRKDCSKIVGEIETVSSARELLNAIEGKKKPPHRLDLIWASKVGELTKSTSPPATRKQQAMFKRVSTILGTNAGPALTKILGDWGGFCLMVMSDRGTSRSPDMPTLEFLVKHLDVAGRFGMVEPVVNSSSKPARPTIVPDVVQVVKEQPATKEEIEAIMREAGV